MAFKILYCPQCAASWDAWEPDPPKCWACGFDKESITRIDAPIPAPESCPDHPKYKAVGKPVSDCPTCWKMFREAVDKQAKEVVYGKR